MLASIPGVFQLFGCCLFTVSCNSEVTLTMMTQYMMGMVQSGCWALFDDTDRLTKGWLHHFTFLCTVSRF
ncbi:hypothetical protein DPMN_059094 [Dreissena polymorpha]|uniref:Dynein heavy chain hydrolytic ATP-binding dynein motor region domain-containing protein n=1 Tax=Dreissena polymorpha TaxID=45954 RepID=A0A9D4HEK4_DREPO|nr:hypothetical protein DPMN_059094 [Dreissena polymorpha]